MFLSHCTERTGTQHVVQSSFLESIESYETWEMHIARGDQWLHQSTSSFDFHRRFVSFIANRNDGDAIPFAIRFRMSECVAASRGENAYNIQQQQQQQ